MTTTGEPGAAPLVDPARRRRRLIAAIAAAVLVAAGGVTVGIARHLDHEYGPLQSGPFSAPYSERAFVFSKDGFSYRLVRSPGATGRLWGSLSNVGDHSVKVTSIDRGSMVTDIRWSIWRVVNGGPITGEDSPWRHFPVIVPAQGTIRLVITIHRPVDCGAHPTVPGGNPESYSGYHHVHWESLLHDHTSDVQIFNRDDGIPVC